MIQHVDDKLHIVHLEQVVSGNDENILAVYVADVVSDLANGIGVALVGFAHSLRGDDVDEASAVPVRVPGVLDVAVE